MARLIVRKSTLTLALMLLTAGIGTGFAQHAITPRVPAPHNGGGGLPVPPDPGPSPNLTALHLR
jgi:hypothetical protein